MINQTFQKAKTICAHVAPVVIGAAIGIGVGLVLTEVQDFITDYDFVLPLWQTGGILGGGLGAAYIALKKVAKMDTTRPFAANDAPHSSITYYPRPSRVKVSREEIVDRMELTMMQNPRHLEWLAGLGNRWLLANNGTREASRPHNRGQSHDVLKDFRQT